MVTRVLKIMLLVLVVTLIIRSVPDIKRYIKIRNM
ncbi:DUF6893 family small protein [Planobispora siamensis]